MVIASTQLQRAFEQLSQIVFNNQWLCFFQSFNICYVLTTKPKANILIVFVHF